MTLQQRVDAMVAKRIEAALEVAINKALGEDSSHAHASKSNGHQATGSSNEIIQDLCDCVRRAVRKSRNGQQLTKKERNLMRRTVKEAKAEHSISHGGNDLFREAGL